MGVYVVVFAVITAPYVNARRVHPATLCPQIETAHQ
jgi:hypothetical protein